MALKVKWAVASNLSIFRGGKSFSSSISNALRQNWKHEINGSEVLGPCKAIQLRYLFQQSRPFSMGYNEAVNKKKKTEGGKVLIYFGEFGSKVKGLKVISYSTSLISLLVQPYIYSDVMAMAVPATAAVYTILGFFTFVTPFLIHSVTKKYVTEIKYDPSEDSYTSKTLTFFLRDKIVNFKLTDVKKVNSASLFNTFFIKGKPMIIFSESFLDKEHYIKMMGYDKPMDFGLYTSGAENKTVKSKSQE